MKQPKRKILNSFKTIESSTLIFSPHYNPNLSAIIFELPSIIDGNWDAVSRQSTQSLWGPISEATTDVLKRKGYGNQIPIFNGAPYLKARSLNLKALGSDVFVNDFQMNLTSDNFRLVSLSRGSYSIPLLPDNVDNFTDVLSRLKFKNQHMPIQKCDIFQYEHFKVWISQNSNKLIQPIPKAENYVPNFILVSERHIFTDFML